MGDYTCFGGAIVVAVLMMFDPNREMKALDLAESESETDSLGIVWTLSTAD